MLTQETRENFLAILREELVPAMGCTEPIAIAYAAARARKILGEAPTGATAKCSGNIIKNVRCVTIPNSGGRVGIEAAVVFGAAAGSSEKGMEVLSGITETDIAVCDKILQGDFVKVELLDSPEPLHIIIELTSPNHRALVEIRQAHTNIVREEKDDEVLFSKDTASASVTTAADRSELSIESIKEFADTVPVADIMPILEPQVRCNMAISQEGMSGHYGLGIGRVIMDASTCDLWAKIKARTAAGSEARMGGCDMPVIINSGSGNQGITSSVPVIVYATESGLTQEHMMRALAFSNLMTIYQKEFIGKLSAFCGVVSASCASGAALTYLAGGSLDLIRMTIANALADTPGIICDGAKVSCAAKIASALDSALIAHHLAMRGKGYSPNTGILKDETNRTISAVGYIGKEGMRQTDKEILKIMLER